MESFLQAESIIMDNSKRINRRTLLATAPALGAAVTAPGLGGASAAEELEHRDGEIPYRRRRMLTGEATFRSLVEPRRTLQIAKRVSPKHCVAH